MTKDYKLRVQGFLNENVGKINEEVWAKTEEALMQIAQYKEDYIKSFLAETGMLPSEVILVERRMADGTTRIWMEKKTEEDHTFEDDKFEDIRE